MAPEGINTKDKFGLTLQKALPLVAIPVVVAKVEQFMDLFLCYTNVVSNATSCYSIVCYC